MPLLGDQIVCIKLLKLRYDFCQLYVNLIHIILELVF